MSEKTDELRKLCDEAYRYHDNAVEGVQAKRRLHELVKEKLPDLLDALDQNAKLAREAHRLQEKMETVRKLCQSRLHSGCSPGSQELAGRVLEVVGDQ